ncbi:hypothetical protein PR048_010280 [Dryococelus australis]|uniref:Reverse transcriptase domain-containing protein n=1 Tax=Dryococelus australis TaxID=614101 RepID=A0ABQ9I2A2_9NEOP|nr:hypothetical protein PR048_010280 [Dryococelus australis]
MVFGKIPKLNISEPETWPHYKTQFAFFLEANKITDTKQLQAMFLTLIRESALALLSSLVTPNELIECRYEESITALDTHFDQKKNEIAACFVFTNRRKQHTETISELAVELTRLSRGYNFQDFEKQLLIQFVCGVKYERLQHQLLSEMDLTQDKTVKLALAFEAANKNSETILASNNEVKQVTSGTTGEVQGCEYMGFQKGNKFKLQNSRSSVLCHKVGHLKQVYRSTTENKVSQVEVCSMNNNSTELEKLGMKKHYEQLYNELVVADSAGRSLLGRNWFGDLGRSVQGIHGTDRDTIIRTYKPLFNEEGLLPLKVSPVHIMLKDNAEPKFQTAVAIPLKNKVNETLDTLVKEGATNFSSWATLVVPVVKRDGSIRICAVYSNTVNACVKPNAYPLPIVKELLATLSGGKILSHLDVKQAYFQLPVDDGTAEILTLSTSRGLMHVKRLPQGLSAAPGLFQNFMEQLLWHSRGSSVFGQHGSRDDFEQGQMQNCCTLSDVFGPLHRLLKDVNWKFGVVEKKAFEACKEFLVRCSIGTL